VSLAHSFFAASHCFLVQVSTCVAVEGFDESGADVAGADLAAGGDTEVCATAAVELMTTAKPIAVSQNRMRDTGAFSLMCAAVASASVALACSSGPHGLITRSRTILCDRVTDPSVGGRSGRNYLVSICRHPFLVFGEAPEGLRALTEFLDGSERRGLARKTSELSRFGTIIMGIRHWAIFRLRSGARDSRASNDRSQEYGV
jgi:hypothetical protein